MLKTKTNILSKITLMLIPFLLIFTLNYAQNTDELSLPSLNLIPNGIEKNNYLLYSDKSGKLKIELGKLMEEKKMLILKCKSLTAAAPDDKKCQTEITNFKAGLNLLTLKINLFNSELEEIVYNDPALDKISIITYYTLKKDQKLWDEFQKNMSIAKKKLDKDKIIIEQELTKIKSTKQKTKTRYNEGVILSMYTEQLSNKGFKDSLESPFTGIPYNQMNTQNNSSNNIDSGVVIVSFVIPKEDIDPLEVASRRDNYIPTEKFSLGSPQAKAELNKLKYKSFNRLIAHSNGATVAECLLNNSLIEVSELNIIGGEKSLINGKSLQQLLDNGTVQKIVVWVKLDDPAVWITNLKSKSIDDRTQNFISYKIKNVNNKKEVKKTEVEYKFILNKGSLATLNKIDSQFIVSYFKEIANEFKIK